MIGPGVWITISNHRMVHSDQIVETRSSGPHGEGFLSYRSDPFIRLASGEYVWCTDVDIAIVEEVLNGYRASGAKYLG